MDNLIEKYKDRLPKSYLDFIRKNKRFEGYLGENLGYVALWDIKELHESWEGYNIDEFLTERWFPIGSNLGGELIVIDTTLPTKGLFYIPFITMSDSDAINYCNDFSILYDAIKQHLVK